MRKVAVAGNRWTPEDRIQDLPEHGVITYDTATEAPFSSLVIRPIIAKGLGLARGLSTEDFRLDGDLFSLSWRTAVGGSNRRAQ